MKSGELAALLGLAAAAMPTRYPLPYQQPVGHGKSVSRKVRQKRNVKAKMAKASRKRNR